MKATIEPPGESVVTLTMTEGEAKTLKNAIGKKTGNEISCFYSDTRMSALYDNLYEALCTVVS